MIFGSQTFGFDKFGTSSHPSLTLGLIGTKPFWTFLFGHTTSGLSASGQIGLDLGMTCIAITGSNGEAQAGLSLGMAALAGVEYHGEAQAGLSLGMTCIAGVEYHGEAQAGLSLGMTCIAGVVLSASGQMGLSLGMTCLAYVGGGQALGPVAGRWVDASNVGARWITERTAARRDSAEIAGRYTT